MKKPVIYILGILTGIALTIGVLFVVKTVKSSHSKITLFEQPIEWEESDDFEVMQTLGDGSALAIADDDLVVLLVDKSGKSFYDNQIVEETRKQQFMQIGLYRYKAKSGIFKTVPVVSLEDKK